MIQTKKFSMLANFQLFSSHLVWPWLAQLAIKTCPNSHHLQGALKFATQISPLPNFHLLLFYCALNAQHGSFH